MKVVDIERIGRPTAEEFRRRYVDRDVPVIIEGAMAHWPAFRAWSDALVLEQAHLFGEDARGCPDAASFTRILASRPKAFYANSWSVTDFPRLFEGIKFYDFQDTATIENMHLWIGAAQSTRMHYDGPHNLHSLLRGTKEFLLARPQAYPNLYLEDAAAPMLKWGLRVSQVDVFAPDEAAFPKIRDVEFHRASLRAGDTLFLPACWWHATVHGKDLGVGFNAWFKAKTEWPEGGTFWSDRSLLERLHG